MKELKDTVQLSKENGLCLINSCRQVLETFRLKRTGSERKFRILKMRYIDIDIFEVAPHWYEYRRSLHHHLDMLEKMLNRPDPIYISLHQYRNLIMLSECDYRANPIFILNY